MKKCKTINDIKLDKRIERFVKDYDGHGKHMVECINGYRFERDRTIEIGTVSEICDSINNNLESMETDVALFNTSNYFNEDDLIDNIKP